MTKKKAPKKIRKERLRPTDKADCLLRAVGEWVESHGGTAIVVGPISIMRFPDDRELIYHVVVKCLGRKPTPLGE